MPSAVGHQPQRVQRMQRESIDKDAEGRQVGAQQCNGSRCPVSGAPGGWDGRRASTLLQHSKALLIVKDLLALRAADPPNCPHAPNPNP